MGERLLEALRRAEEKAGIGAFDDVLGDVLAYTCRKLVVIGKPDSYLPVLFETELLDHAMRRRINAPGGVL